MAPPGRAGTGWCGCDGRGPEEQEGPHGQYSHANLGAGHPDRYKPLLRAAAGTNGHRVQRWTTPTVGGQAAATGGARSHPEPALVTRVADATRPSHHAAGAGVQDWQQALPRLLSGDGRHQQQSRQADLRPTRALVP